MPSSALLYVEKKIKSAMRSGNLKEFQAWQQVLHGELFKPAHVTYEFSDGTRLLDYAINESNQLVKQSEKKPWYWLSYFWNRRRFTTFILPAQSLISIVFQAITYVSPSEPEKSLSFWQRYYKKKIQSERSNKSANLTLSAGSINEVSVDLFTVFASKLSEGLVLNKNDLLEQKEEKVAPDKNVVSKGITPTTLKPLKDQLDSKKEFKEAVNTFNDYKSQAVGDYRQKLAPEDFNPKNLKEARLKARVTVPSETLKFPNYQGIRADEKKEGQSEQELPLHLRHWVQQKVLVQQFKFNQEQKEQITDLLEHKENKNENQDYMFGKTEEQEKYVDSSYLSPINFSSREDNSIIGLANAVKKALERKYAINSESKTSITIFVSERLKGVLAGVDEKFYGDGLGLESWCYLNLDNLPLGFRVEPIESHSTNTRAFSITFSDELRKEQLNKQKSILSFDPAAYTEETPLPKIELSPSDANSDWDAFLLMKNITLNNTQKLFLKNSVFTLKRAGHDPNIVYWNENTKKEEIQRLKNAFKILINEAGVNADTLFPEFLNVFIKLETLEFEGHATTNLFDTIYKCFLSRDPNFLNVESLELLKKLTGLSPNERKLFYRMSLRAQSLASLKELWGALEYFLNFLKVNALTITPELATYFSHQGTKEIFYNLNLVITCLDLSRLQPFQATLLNFLPKQLGPSTEYLHKGYAFVHKDMNLANSFFPKDLSSLINQTPEEIKQTFTQSGHNPDLRQTFSDAQQYRALYLRYIASMVDLDQVEAAYHFWESTTGQKFLTASASSEEQRTQDKALDKILEAQWPILLSYLQKLRTRFQMPSQRLENAFTVGNDPNGRKIYPNEDIEELFSRLDMEKSRKTRLIYQILQINNEMPETAVLKEAKDLRPQFETIKKRFHHGENIDSVRASALGLFRELHYRSTFNTSLSKPKVGEWLRLEQVLTVLDACNSTSRLYQVETSEGKTLILSLMALLEAMQGEQVTLLTHNESMAAAAAVHMDVFADFLGLDVARENSSSVDIKMAPFYFANASTAMLEDKCAQLQYHSDYKPRGGTVIIDEADTTLIDLYASTTMQIARPVTENSALAQATEKFVQSLNVIIRQKLAQNLDTQSKEDQIKFIRKNLSVDIPEGVDLEYWIKAVVTSMTLNINDDYVVQDEHVHIVQKDTSGYVDTKSEWGNGVHYSLALWEQRNNPSIQLPGFSAIIAEVDIANYLKQFKKRIALTGSSGSEATQNKMNALLQPDTKPEEQAAPLMVPRAKRPANDGGNWPLKSKKVRQTTSVNGKVNVVEFYKTEIVYNKMYRHPVQIVMNEKQKDFKEDFVLQKATQKEQNKKNHWSLLFLTIQREIAKGHPILIPFTKIKECIEFHAFLELNGVNNIQILDNKKPDLDSKEFRPPEPLVVREAGSPGKITLTTAVGGRAINFDYINGLCLIPKPSLSRVFKQKADRVARNGRLGRVQEIYNIDDLDAEAQLELEADLNKERSADKEYEEGQIKAIPFQSILERMQDRLEQNELDKIGRQQPARDKRIEFQEKMLSQFQEAQDLDAANKILDRWCTFFTSATTKTEPKEVEQVLKQFK